jgi:glutathione S-transferase
MERLSTIVPALAAAGLFIAVGSSAAVAKKGKPKLYYFYGRGLGEAARFALGATGVEWDNIFIRNRAQMLELLSADRLKFQQLPLLEMPDGSTSVQSGAILRHIGRAYNLYGASDAEANLIDNLVEGIKDFGGKCPGWPTPEARAELADDVKALNEKHFPRYLGAFEKQLQLNGSGFLVGKGITIADTLLLRYIEEVFDWVGKHSFCLAYTRGPRGSCRLHFCRHMQRIHSGSQPGTPLTRPPDAADAEKMLTPYPVRVRLACFAAELSVGRWCAFG